MVPLLCCACGVPGGASDRLVESLRLMSEGLEWQPVGCGVYRIKASEIDRPFHPVV